MGNTSSADTEPEPPRRSSQTAAAPVSRRRSSQERASQAAAQAAAQQSLEALKAECVELEIEVPPDATREELLEAIAAARNKKRPSFWKMATDSYDELVNAIIRPPRAEYSVSALGRRTFQVDGISHERYDFELTNSRNMKLQCSWWRPRLNPGQTPALTPCVIYLHGNSSCRAEALETLPAVLGSRMSLFAFDFAGSGMSEGEYVSLGFFEREDLETIVNYLRASGRVSTIGLWGRSMGAVTALLFVDRDPSISCIICDSPFSSLRTLAKELVESAQLNVPKFAVGLGLRMVRSSVKTRANFDINVLEPITNASKCFVPALFAAAEGDFFIRPKHAEEIFHAYAGDKNIVKFPGDHNSRRPDFFLDSCIIFMHNAMIHDGSTVAHSHDHQTNVDAGVFHMPAPLAHSPRSQMVNQQGPAFDSTSHHRQQQPTQAEQHLASDRIFGPIHREVDDFDVVDEEAAFEKMMQQAMLLSLEEAGKGNKTSQ